MEKADIQRTLADQPAFSNLNFSMKHTRGAPELFNLSEESIHSIRGMYLQSISVVESDSDVSEMQDESVLTDKTKVRGVRWQDLKHEAMAPNFVISGKFNAYTF